MNFCSNCGSRVSLRVPPGDTVPRHVCGNCNTIHYRNPLVVVGALPVWKDDRVLLAKRAIEPRAGYWTLPAGFMELGETVAQGAIRETLEEATARIEDLELFTMLSVPHVNQVHVFYRARLMDLDFAPGTESLETELFHEADIPWKDISFRTVTTTLRLFFEDRARGQFRVHADEILPPK